MNTVTIKRSPEGGFVLNYGNFVRGVFPTVAAAKEHYFADLDALADARADARAEAEAERYFEEGTAAERLYRSWEEA